MPFTYIVDTNPAVQGNADTFATFDACMTHIYDTHGVYLDSGGDAGLVTINFRNSSGVPLNEFVDVNRFFPNGTNRIEIVGQMANGFPAVVEDWVDNTETLVFRVYDDYIDVYGETEDSFIIRGDLAVTTGKALFSVSKDMSKFERISLDGVDSSYYAGISGSNTATGSHLKIVRCKRQFYGAIRAGNVSLDHCTINNCRLIRSSGIITNSIVANITSHSENDGFIDGSDYNIYDVDKATIKYNSSVADTSLVDVNSQFSVDIAANFNEDTFGAYNLKAGSVAENADSTGTGNPGADTDALVGEPPQLSIYLNGDTLTAVVSDDATANPSLQLYIDGVAQGSAQTATSWDMTQFALATGVYRLSVEATDDDSNSAVSNERYYSVGGILKVLFLGNSLTQTPVEPAGVSDALYHTVRKMFQSVGSDIFIDWSMIGGATFEEHYGSTVSRSKISSGNYDVILMQGEGNDYADDAWYDTWCKPMVDDAKAANTDWVFWAHWHRENETDRYADRLANQVNGAARMGCDLIDTISAWHNIQANNPTFDLYADNTHQNLAGEFINAIAIYRYLTGNPSSTPSYVQPLLTTDVGSGGLGYTTADLDIIRTQVDTDITNQFVRTGVNSCSVIITQPSGAIDVTVGTEVTFTATATDSSTGDLSANIVWKDNDGVTLHTGNTFSTTTLPTGNLLITANCVGSDGKTTTAARSVKVRTLVNSAPVTQKGYREVDYQSPFTQLSLAALMTDDNDELDLNTLTITQQPRNCTAVQDGQTLTTLNVDYSGTEFYGTDTLKYTIADMDGAVSNESVYEIYVKPPPASTGTLRGGLNITRGSAFVIDLERYWPNGDASMVEVYVVDTSDGTEYKCTVTANAKNEITCTAPNTIDLTTTLSNATIRIKPIATLGKGDGSSTANTNELQDLSFSIAAGADGILRSTHENGSVPSLIAGPLNVYHFDGSVAVGGLFDRPGVVVTANDATWEVIEEDALGGSFEYFTGGGYSYSAGSTAGIAYFKYLVRDGNEIAIAVERITVT